MALEMAVQAASDAAVPGTDDRVGLIDRWRRFVGADERSGYPLSFNQWLQEVMIYGGQTYALQGGTLSGNVDEIGHGFGAYVNGAYKANGVVFACELARMTLFSEARFQWRELRQGRPGRLFGTTELRILEEPWPGGTTGDLLTRMILDADMAGNAFVRKVGRRLERLRPDWVSIVYAGDPWEPTTDVMAYIYEPGGPGIEQGGRHHRGGRCRALRAGARSALTETRDVLADADPARDRRRRGGDPAQGDAVRQGRHAEHDRQGRRDGDQGAVRRCRPGVPPGSRGSHERREGVVRPGRVRPHRRRVQPPAAGLQGDPGSG